MIVSALESSEHREVTADLCIVGAGAAGLDMARFFNAAKVSVVVVEGGGLEFSQETQELHQFVSIGKDFRSRATEFNPHLAPSYRSESRIRQFGGTTNIWSGKWKARVPDDFQEKLWIPHSGWPVGYNDLLPYYLEVARDYQVPEFLFDLDALGRLDRHDGIESSLVNVVHYQQLPPLNFNQAFRSELEGSENVTVMLNANAVRLVLDEELPAVRYLVAKSLGGHTVSVHAEVFVLAAGGLENAKLLLNSHDASGRTLGNEYDLVGRFYMDHPKAVWGSLVPRRRRRLKRGQTLQHGGGFIQLGLGLSEAVREKHRLPNHNTYLRPVPFGANLETSNHPRFLRMTPRLFVNRAVKWFGRFLFVYAGMVSYYELIHYLEQIPCPGSRVYLCGDRRDRLNEPLLVVEWKLADADLCSFRKYLNVLRDVLRNQGVGDIHFPEEEVSLSILADASHHMGTTRMADSDERGVVDRTCKVFGINNLYMAGSSVFPTAGNANPTLTLLALTRRLSHHLRSVMGW